MNSNRLLRCWKRHEYSQMRGKREELDTKLGGVKTALGQEIAYWNERQSGPVRAAGDGCESYANREDYRASFWRDRRDG
jgi:hypothetical protein